MLLSVLPTVYQGALAPEAFRAHIRQGCTGVDLTTVTGATLSVRRPDGEEVTWAVTLAAGPNPPAATPTDLWLLHPYDAGDVDDVGRYAFFANLTIPGGVVRSDPAEFKVVSKFGI